MTCFLLNLPIVTLDVSVWHNFLEATKCFLWPSWTTSTEQLLIQRMLKLIILSHKDTAQVEDFWGQDLLIGKNVFTILTLNLFNVIRNIIYWVIFCGNKSFLILPLISVACSAWILCDLWTFLMNRWLSAANWTELRSLAVNTAGWKMNTASKNNWGQFDNRESNT